MSGLRTVADYVRNAAGTGLNACSYAVTRLFDDASVASGATATDADPATTLPGFFDEDETAIGYPGPLKYVVTTPSGVRTHTSKSVGLVGPWRSVDLTRAWYLLGKGVVPGIGTDLAVTTNGANMVISVAAGEYLARIADHGLVYAWPVARTLTATAADPAQPRIDTVVLRFYPPGVAQEGRIDLVLRAGTPAGSPAAVSLHQSTDYWEEALADVRVDAAVGSLAANKVTDRRTYLVLLPSAVVAGDTFYVDAAGKFARLAKGTDGQYLHLASGLPAWDTIDNADLPTGIDAAKIADGSVSNAEFQYLGTVTSDVQTQLDGKQPLDSDLTAFAAKTAPTGAVVGTTDTQALTNKTLDATTTLTVKDTLFTIQDDGDATKQAKFQASGIAAGNTRTLTIPDISDTLAVLSFPQTLTNKTLVSPSVTGTLTSAGDTVLGDATADTHTITGHVQTAGGAPAIAANAAAGTGRAAAIVFGNDTAGLLRVDVGTSPTTGNFFTVTNLVARSSANYTVILTPADDNADGLTKQPFVNKAATTTTFWTAKINSAPTASVSCYFWFFIIG